MATMLFLVSCSRPPRNLVNIKVFALNPENYLKKNVSVNGKILDLAPAGAGFSLSDSTGTVFVSSELTSEKFRCPKNAHISVDGFLWENSSIQQTYFMMTNVYECDTHSVSEGH